MLFLFMFGSFVCLSFTCSPPEGWRTQTFKQRSQSAETILIGTFESLTNETLVPSSYYKNVQIHMNVDCVLKNDANLNISNIMTAEEVSPTPRCVSNLDGLVLGKKSVVFLETSFSNKIEISTINVQQGYEDYSHELMQVLLTDCGLQNMTSVAGKCPFIPYGLRCYDDYSSRTSLIRYDVITIFIIITMVMLWR